MHEASGPGSRVPARGKKAGAVLGFDYGRKRIGVAVGETVTGTARALTALHGRGDGTPPWGEIETLLEEWRPTGLVVGLPRHLDGREAPIAASARTFARELGRRAELPVALCDETLSTEAARATLAERRRAGARRTSRDDLNAEAARQILQTWLGENA